MRRLFVAFATACALVGGLSEVSQAAGTSVSFTLTAAGGLTISVPTSANLGTVPTASGTLSAKLGAVTVTDDRGLLNGNWTASVVSTDFTTGAGSAQEKIAAANVYYWSGAATATSGTGVFTPGQLLAANKVSLSVSRTAFSATSTAGNNSVTWDPTVEVSIPATAVVGAYTGTVTHSVA